MTSCVANFVDRKLYNLHCHTQFCDGRADMRAFVEAAIALGYSTLGFSPHSPLPIPSACNMDASVVEAYLTELHRLQTDYSGKIELLAGMEIDYLGKDWGPAHEYFQSLPLDYRIGSVHFIADRDGQPVDVDGNFLRFRNNMQERFKGDIRYVVDSFFNRTLEMIERGGFDILGHLDKIARNASLYRPGIEDEPWFVSHVGDVIDSAAARGVAVEINTKVSDSTGRIFPRERYLGRLKNAGVTMIVNSDAHRPELIDAGRAYAFRLLDDLPN